MASPPQSLYGSSYSQNTYSQNQGHFTQQHHHGNGNPTFSSQESTEPYDTGQFELVTTQSSLADWWGISSSEVPGDAGEADSANDWAWTWDRTLKSLVLSPIVIFTILGNFLVLYAFMTRRRDLRSPTHFFIANLSLADFLVGILAMPFLATLHTTDRWYFSVNFCFAWVIIHFWLCSASILSTLGVCLERYIGVKYPLRHNDIMNHNRVIGTILGIWGMAGFLSLVSVLAFPEPNIGDVGRFGCKLNNQLGHVLIATIGILYIPAGLMVFLYWRIYLIASTHLRAMKGRASSGGGGARPPQTAKAPRPRSKTKTWSKLNLFRFSATPTTSEQDHTHTNTNTQTNSDDPAIPQYSTEESGFSSFSSSSFAEQPVPVGVVEIDLDNKEDKPSVVTISQSQSVASLDRSRKQINLARRLAFLVGILLISYIPFFTAFLIRAVEPGGVPDTLFTILGWIRYSNSAINPVIYAYAVPGYRKAFESILLGWRRR